VAAEGALDHAGVDDVGGCGPGGERAGGSGLRVMEGLDDASGQQPRQEGAPKAVLGRQAIMATAWLPPGDTVFGTDKPSERETPVQRQ
jgi:hypothetical protein